MTKPSPKRVELVVRLDKIQQNFLTIRRHVRPAEVMVVLKANAYGLGVGPISRALFEVGARWFGVANLPEALEIRQQHNKANILILGSVLMGEVSDAINNNIVLPIGSFQSALDINRTAEQLGIRATAHVLVDTGMGRLGLLYDEATKALQQIERLPYVDVKGIYSHLSLAYDPKSPQTELQLGRFNNILANAKKTFEWVHLANSDAINNFGKNTHFNMVRTGINLYGLFDLLGHKIYQLEEVLEFFAALVEVRTLPKGFGVGYGATHILERETRIGTISVGYADGLPYAASNKAKMLVRGKPCNIVGRVSMDYTTIDLTPCPEAKVDDRVLLVGAQGGNSISIEYWSEIKKTHPYDVVCSLGRRVRKTYAFG